MAIGFPLTIGIAIFRHRLYEIDVIINRTLVYGALTAVLLATYVTSVQALQYTFRHLTGEQSSLAVSLRQSRSWPCSTRCATGCKTD